LERLLADFDDGRRKNFFCLAVNLLELPDIREVMAQQKQSLIPHQRKKRLWRFSCCGKWLTGER
jgi:hypothetical protein